MIQSYFGPIKGYKKTEIYGHTSEYRKIKGLDYFIHPCFRMLLAKPAEGCHHGQGREGGLTDTGVNGHQDNGGWGGDFLTHPAQESDLGGEGPT